MREKRSNSQDSAIDNEILHYNNYEHTEIPYGTERISNLAIQLEVYMREIKDMRERRSNIRDQISEIVDNGMILKQVENEKAQYAIFEKLLKSLDKNKKRY